jgi:hypothetical protein
MSHLKVSTLDDCREHSQFIERAVESAKTNPDIIVYEVGKHVRIKNTRTGDCTELLNDCRDLPKPARAVIANWLRRLGVVCILGALAVGGILNALHMTAADVVRMVTAQ